MLVRMNERTKPEDADLIRRDALLLLKADISGDNALMRSVLTTYVSDPDRTGDLMEQLVHIAADHLQLGLAVELMTEAVPDLAEPLGQLCAAIESNPAKLVEHLDARIGLETS